MPPRNGSLQLIWNSILSNWKTVELQKISQKFYLQWVIDEENFSQWSMWQSDNRVLADIPSNNACNPLLVLDELTEFFLCLLINHDWFRLVP